jgi:hypothetical protein
MLEKKLQEELNRYKAINKYGKTMIMEQEAPAAPAPDPALDTPPTPEEDPTMGAPTPDAGIPANPALDAPAPDAGMDMGADPAMAGGMDAGMDAGMDTGMTPEMDSTEEIDITDLVDMTKSIKKDLENHTQDQGSVVAKMDDVFSKLGELETKLAEMDNLVAKIDGLGSKIEQMKPQTPQEKLEMRSLDSYPFNEKPQEFFAHKQGEMQASGKNEYVLTKDDIDNYPDDIKGTFNPENEEDEYRF